MSVEEKVEMAKEAIDKVHSDTSVSMETTLDKLEEIRCHVEDLIECVDSEING